MISPVSGKETCFQILLLFASLVYPPLLKPRISTSDPRTNNLPLVGNPFHGLAVLGFYLYFVLNLGPRIMKNRPPMQLKPLLTLFNIFQIGSSVLIFYKVSDWCFTRLCSTERCR